MKKLNNSTHIFIFLTLFSCFLFSCGTEEEIGEETIKVTVSSSSVIVGTPVTFTATSTIAGDVTTEAVYYVNGAQITGNTYTPTQVNLNNEVYAVYNGLTSPTVIFSSIEEATTQFTQKLLLEDYTGTWCGYCPRMTTIVEYLTSYSDRIVPVAIHCPGAPTDPWTFQYALEMANTSNYNVQGRPDGRFNRIYPIDMLQGSQFCPNDPTAYYPQADVFLNQTAPLGLAINSNLNGNQLNINVKVGFATDNISDARLVVYLLENNLAYNQANYYSGDNSSCDPNHNYSSMPNPIPGFKQDHVLLKSYTDVYGDVIPQNEITAGGVYTRTLNVSLPSNVGIGFGGAVRPDELSIVAFVLGNGQQVSNRGVINVQSAKVGENKDFD